MTNNIDSITRELHFNAPIQQVWEAISDPLEMQKWFGSAASFELKEKALGYFEWEEECEGRFAMRIESVSPFHYLAWRWMHYQDVAFDAATSTLVEWKLESTAEGGTVLQLTESGFAEAKHRASNIEGWEQELNDLANYLT